jgi:hypothetical protein
MRKCASNEQTCEVTLNALDKKVLGPKPYRSVDPKVSK